MKLKSLLGLLFLGLYLSMGAQEGQIPVEELQKSLITKRTATWCPVCGKPDVWPILKRINANLHDKALGIAGHYAPTSALHRPITIDFLENLEESYSQPRFYFNNEYIGNRGTTTETRLEEKINAAFEIAPIAQSGMIITYDHDQRVLKVNGRVEFFQTATGKYFLAFYLVQKLIITQQAYVGEEAEHQNVLWDVLGEGPFGEVITYNGAKVRQSFLVEKEITLPEDLNLNNVLVASMIWKEKGDKFGLVNIEYSDDIQIVLDNYSHQEIESLSIQPTITSGDSQLVIDLKAALKQTEILIFNELGEMVKKVFHGNLAKGRHQFTIQLASPGTYIITLSSGNSITSKRVIKINN